MNEMYSAVHAGDKLLDKTTLVGFLLRLIGSDLHYNVM